MSDGFSFLAAATAPTPTEPDNTGSDAAPAPSDDYSFADALTAPTDAPTEPAPAETPSLSDRFSPLKPITNQVGMAIKVGQGTAKVAAGVIQASLAGLEKMGIVDKGTEQDFTKLTNEERAKFNEMFKQAFGDGAGFHIAEAGGEILPAFALPVTSAAAVPSALVRVGIGAATGALTGAAGYQESEDPAKRAEGRLTGAEVGAAAGGVGSAALETITSLRNWIPKAIDKVKAEYGTLIQQGIDLQNRTGVAFKLSQLFQGKEPLAEVAERFTREGTAGERIARQIEDAQPQQVLNYFESLLTNNRGAQIPFGKRVQVAFDRILGDTSQGTGLLGNRAMAANRNFQAAGKAGGYIDMTNFTGDALKLVNEFSAPGAGATEQRMAAELQRIVTDIMDSTGGRLTPKQLQGRLKAWGDASKGSGKIFSDAVDNAAERGPAKMLFAALNRDLDEAISAGGAGAAELKIARDAYAMDTAKIEMLRESALGKLFDVKGTPTATEIEGKFLAMNADDIRSTMSILGKTDPQARQHLANLWLSRAIERAKVPGEAGAVEFLPAKMLDIFSGAKGKAASTNRETFEAVFTDPKMRMQVMDGIKAVQTMMVNNVRTSGRTVARAKNLANQVAQASRTQGGLVQSAVGLASRYASDWMAPKALAQYVLDPRGVKALNTLAKNPNDNAASAAMAQLWNIYSSSTQDDSGE